jgi:tetratricopeptide (TPR) repeat protein
MGNFSAMTATALFFMMLLSSQQVRYWQNSVTLMSNAVEATKNNYVAHENLGLALIERGLYDQALYHFKQSVAINPKFANAYLNIGSCYMLRKEYENAIISYQKAIAIKKDLALAYDLIGKALKATGKQAESELYLKRARQLESAGKQPSN